VCVFRAPANDITTVADANGNIDNRQFLIKDNHLGVAFVLTATGQTSGLVQLQILLMEYVVFSTQSGTAARNWGICNILVTQNSQVYNNQVINFRSPGPSTSAIPVLSIGCNQYIFIN
jgi:hypothetical protein